MIIKNVSNQNILRNRGGLKEKVLFLVTLELNDKIKMLNFENRKTEHFIVYKVSKATAKLKKTKGVGEAVLRLMNRVTHHKCLEHLGEHQYHAVQFTTDSIEKA